MTRAIEEHLVPLGFVAPQANREVVGGYFIWLELPRHLRGTALATRCQQEEGLIIAPGKIFEVPGDAAVQCDGNIRLCFAWEDEPLLSEGVRRIADVARRMLAAKHGDGVGGGVEVETDTAAMLRTFR
jgi:DNA-binding transcriptional MocR family regulator